MSRLHLRMVVLTAAAALFAAAFACAQEPVTATLQPSGLIGVTRGGVEMATIDLNAHGPGWDHAPQESATGEVSDLAAPTEKRVVGSLPIPSTDGGAIEYTETVTALPQGLQIAYDLTMSKTMRLSGLQLSVNLPVAVHGGGEVMILQPHDDAEVVGLPADPEESRSQLWSGAGATVEVAKEDQKALTIQLRAATDVVVQDLREWESDVFEVRFPAIMEAGGREVQAGDRFHLDLTLTFPGSLTLEGP